LVIAPVIARFPSNGGHCSSENANQAQCNVFHGCELFWFMTTQHGPLIGFGNYASVVLLLPAAIGSFSIAAIQQAIKNPARGGAKY
jgi:hypothetical protein